MPDRSMYNCSGDRLTCTFFMAAALLVSIGLAVQYFNWDIDDTFIIYRYAENILSGTGWRYNPGEVYNASTSVLNTVMIAAASLATKDPRLSAHILDGVWLFMAGATLFLIFRARFGPLYASIAALSVITALGNDGLTGLEIHLFIALALLFVYLESSGRNCWPVLGLIVLARPDGILFLAAKTVMSWRRHRKFPWSGVALSALVLVPWAVYSLYSFHQVLPSTLRQKMWQGRSGFWGHGLAYLHGFLRFLFHKALYWRWWAAVAAAWAYVGARAIVLERSTLLYLLVFVSVQQAAYVLLNVAFYEWYGAFFYITALICALYGLGLAVVWIKKAALERYGRPSWLPAQVWLNTALGLSVLSVSVLLSWRMMSTPQLYGPAESYRQLAHEINVNTPSGMVASAEVGVLGYYTKREMLDLVGLTSNRGEFITGANNDAFFRLLPGVVVLHNPLREYETAVRLDSRFSESYVKRGALEHGEGEKIEYFVLKGV